MKVVWDEIALLDIAAIKVHLRQNWGETVADNFVKMVLNKIEILKNQPEFGRPSTKYPDVRKVQIGKRQMMYYRLTKSEIQIVAFFDMKQNPSKNKLE